MTLLLPGNDSLKGKRKVVRRVLDRVRNKFNAAAAEVGELDVKRRAMLGFAVVSNDGSHANAMLDTLADFVRASADAVVADQSIELIHMGEG